MNRSSGGSGIFGFGTGSLSARVRLRLPAGNFGFGVQVWGVEVEGVHGNVADLHARASGLNPEP